MYGWTDRWTEQRNKEKKMIERKREWEREREMVRGYAYISPELLDGESDFYEDFYRGVQVHCMLVNHYGIYLLFLSVPYACIWFLYKICLTNFFIGFIILTPLKLLSPKKKIPKSPCWFERPGNLMLQYGNRGLYNLCI